MYCGRSMISLRRVVLLLLPLAAIACGRPSASRPDVAAASESERSPFLRACASCHGADARGAGPAAGALRVSPPDLTLLAARNGGVFPRDAVLAVVTGARTLAAHGSREMPVWSITFDPPSGPTAVASIVAQQRVDAIVHDLESRQRTP